MSVLTNHLANRMSKLVLKFLHRVMHDECVMCGKEYSVFKLNHDPSDIVPMCEGCAADLEQQVAA